jgi:hypothetical protein
LRIPASTAMTIKGPPWIYVEVYARMRESSPLSPGMYTNTTGLSRDYTPSGMQPKQHVLYEGDEATAPRKRRELHDDVNFNSATLDVLSVTGSGLASIARFHLKHARNRPQCISHHHLKQSTIAREFFHERMVAANPLIQGIGADAQEYATIPLSPNKALGLPSCSFS